MKYIHLIILSIVCLSCFNPLYAQKRKKRIKPVYHGKLQGGYIIDEFTPKTKGYAGFNYLNLGVRKVVGDKIREWGLETFYYKEDHSREVINDFYNYSYRVGNKQTGFGISYYQYLMLKQWNFGKLNIQIGPQFSFGYYHNNVQPLATHSFPKTYNDFKLSGTARLELNYKIDERYSFIVGSQYTLFQFGLRRISHKNPIVPTRHRLEDFVQFDFLVDRQIFYVGILTQFGKVKIDRAKIKKKREKERQRKKEKIAKKQEKREKKKSKQMKKREKKREKKKSKS